MAGNVIHMNKAGFDKARENGGVMLVDFWATWCGPCKMVAPTIEALSELYAGKVIVGKVDVDQEPELATEYGVMSIPTVIVLKDGVEVDRKVGVMPQAVYEEAVNQEL